MQLSTYTIAVISYFVIGLVVCIYLLMTRENYAEARIDSIDAVGCMAFFLPDVAILVVAFWPVYVGIRLWRRIRNVN